MDDLSSASTAHDYTDSNNAPNSGAWAYNTPKILPNAAGTCLTQNFGWLTIFGSGPLNLRANTGAWTLVGFFKITTPSAYWVFSNYASANPTLSVDIVAGGQLHYWYRDSAATLQSGNGAHNDFQDGNAHLVAFEFDWGARTWRILSDNDRLEASGSLTANAYSQAGCTFFLGDNFAGPYSAEPFKGIMQDWFILPRTLTAGEMQAYYFYAGLGGAAPFVPPNPTVPPDLPANPPAGPSCSTIADLCAELQVLYQAILNNTRNIVEIRGQVDLLQQYKLPAGYDTGTVHSGLTGSGTIAIPTNLVGLRCELTTTKPGTLQLPGTPGYLWDCGWMSIDDTAGMLEEKRVTRLSFEWFPESMPLASSFGYALNPYFTLQVTELTGKLAPL